MAATASSDKKLVVYPAELHGVKPFSSSSPYAARLKTEIADWLAARTG